MTWKFRLYIAGMTPIANRAITNIKRICDQHLPDDYDLTVIDLNKQPSLAETDQIVAIPTLLRMRPEPRRKVIGDLSDTQKVITGLQIQS